MGSSPPGASAADTNGFVRASLVLRIFPCGIAFLGLYALLCKLRAPSARAFVQGLPPMAAPTVAERAAAGGGGGGERDTDHPPAKVGAHPPEQRRGEQASGRRSWLVFIDGDGQTKIAKLWVGEGVADECSWPLSYTAWQHLSCFGGILRCCEQTAGRTIERAHWAVTGLCIARRFAAS